jgi:hypothetical protein
MPCTSAHEFRRLLRLFRCPNNPAAATLNPGGFVPGEALILTSIPILTSGSSRNCLSAFAPDASNRWREIVAPNPIHG